MLNAPVPLEQLSVLNQLRDLVAQNATNKGFRAKFAEGLSADQWSAGPGQLIRASVYCINLIGEISEFWEAFRSGTLDSECDKADKMRALGLPGLTCAEEEIADQLIRVLDKAEAFGVDVARAVSAKMAYNASRPALHGNKNA
jgi:hypothetical protein